MEESKENDSMFGRHLLLDDEITAPPNWVETYNKATSGGAQYVFAKDVSTDGRKCFTKDLSHAQMLRYQLTQPRCERNFYEILLDDKPVKLFYDIDISPALDNMELLDQLVREVMAITIISLKELYGVNDLDVQDFAVLDSSGEVNTTTGITTKTSVHIVLVNKVRFKNIQNMKDYVTFVFSDQAGYLKDKIDLHVDKGVYRRRGSLRIPGSTKRGQNRHLVIITPQFTELDCMLTYTQSDSDDIQILEKPLKRNNKRKEDQIIRSMQTRIAAQQITNNDIFQKVVDALPDHLATEYYTWISVGINLSMAGADEMYWHQFSKKCVREYNYELAHNKWMSFAEYGTGSLAGLFRLLKTHGREDIAQEMTTHTVRFMGKYNNDIAFSLARMFGDDHIYSKGSWYFFDGNKWIIDENQTHISRTIMTKFHNKLNQELKNIDTFISNVPSDHPQYHEETARMKNLITIKDKTQSGRINNDWHTLNVAFEQPFFADHLDSIHFTKDLIAFDNGVYDLKSNLFRQSTRDDKISKTTRYNYCHPYEIDPNDDAALTELLRQIFPDDHIYNYMMCFLGSCLSGAVHDELIHFWTGLSNKQTGSNGKSTFVTLLLKVFGDYGATGHSSIITSKRESASSTNSALMSLKGKRLVTFQEIDNETMINMPVIKSITGNDEVTGRQLYQQQETFLPQWKLIVCANKLPPVSSDDGGTQRRLRNIPFESKFVADITHERWRGMLNIFPIDTSLKMRLDRYRMPLMNRLIAGYNEYKRLNTLPLCPKIIIHTETYLLENNMVYHFIKNNIVPKEGEYVKLKQIVSCANNSNTSRQVYKEEDVIDICKECFPQMIATPLSEHNPQLVFWDYCINNES